MIPTEIPWRYQYTEKHYFYAQPQLSTLNVRAQNFLEQSKPICTNNLIEKDKTNIDKTTNNKGLYYSVGIWENCTVRCAELDVHLTVLTHRETLRDLQ